MTWETKRKPMDLPRLIWHIYCVLYCVLLQATLNKGVLIEQLLLSNILITGKTSPVVCIYSLLTASVQNVFVYFSSITNIPFLNVMAKCHPVNGRAYNSDTGRLITLKSKYVAWMCDMRYFHLISLNDFSDLVENIGRGKMSGFSDIWPGNIGLHGWCSVSSNDWNAVDNDMGLETHIGSWWILLLWYYTIWEGTLNLETGHGGLTFKNYPEGGPITPRHIESWRHPWVL